MQRRLFLCGPSGCGKSAMIRAALAESLAGAGGFVTERVSAPDGRLLGFDLLPSAAAGGIEGFEGARFLDYSCDPPKKDNEVFRLEAVRLLQEAEYYPYVLLDEQFRAALADFLSSSVPCIGVIKDLAGVYEQQRHFGLGERFPALALKLREALERDGDTLVLDTSGRGDEHAAALVRRWTESYAF